MHLVLYARGIIQQVELWKAMAQGQFFKWGRKNLKTGKIEYVLVQGALRPSILGAWEYVFPKECLAEVINILGIHIPRECEHGFKFKAKSAVLRKIHGVKKIPKEIIEEAKKIQSSILLENSWRGLSHIIVQGVSIHAVGIKEDVVKEIPQWGYEQEML